MIVLDMCFLESVVRLAPLTVGGLFLSLGFVGQLPSLSRQMLKQNRGLPQASKQASKRERGSDCSDNQGGKAQEIVRGTGGREEMEREGVFCGSESCKNLRVQVNLYFIS